MNPPDIKSLLGKFIKGECTPEEARQVADYFRANKLTDDFPTVEEVSAYRDSLPKIDDETANRIFSEIISAEKIVPIKRRPIWKYASVAAVLMILLSVGWSYQKGYFSKNGTVDTKVVAVDQNAITLELANGDVRIISSDGSMVVKDKSGKIIARQKAGEIAYEAGNSAELAYNTLRIPYGKRFEISLSDGTHVHLNSGTTLKYPVNFIAGEQRKVFLDGEAYFDVAKDKTRPFIVNADNLNVGVLGTHFNVSNYPEDSLSDVVLVEGSVCLFTSDEGFDPAKNKILVPGEKGSFDKKSNKIASKKVVTDFHTAWVRGELHFENMSFANIAKKLERKYDIRIVNEDKSLDSATFNASFKDEPLSKVLGYFAEIHGIQYSIDNKTVTIKKPPMTKS